MIKPFIAVILSLKGAFLLWAMLILLNGLKTLDQVRNIEMEYFVPGHGMASDQPQETMDLTYRYLNFLIKQLTLFVDEMTPFDEAYSAIDWSGI